MTWLFRILIVEPHLLRSEYEILQIVQITDILHLLLITHGCDLVYLIEVHIVMSRKQGVGKSDDSSTLLTLAFHPTLKESLVSDTLSSLCLWLTFLIKFSLDLMSLTLQLRDF